jgi:pimeloyl-ACP methyl ester carboxylesterase
MESDLPTPPPHLLHRGTSRLLLVMLAALSLTATLLPGAATAGENPTELSGELPDGTRYLMTVPDAWNGVLISDLDYVTRANNPGQRALLEHGYALSGTARHPLRRYEYDPDFEIQKLLDVRDRFVDAFGEPTYVIAHGYSGGGNVALGTAEHYGDEVDGAIANCAHDAIPLMNQGLDLFFVLKSLLAPERDDLWPDSELTLLPDDHSAITTAWQEVLDDALATPEGRARMALALTISQYPAWVSGEKPDARDLEAVTATVLETVRSTALNNRIGGQSRVMFEFSGGALSWNTGVDYERSLRDGNAVLKRVVRELYSEADLDLTGDLETVNAAPRIAPDEGALEFWRQPGRHVTGDLRVPLLRTHTAGDLAVPPAVMQGYAAQVRSSGTNALYRAAFVDRAGHCNYTAAEEVAQVEIMVHRLETGRWPSTSPKQLNRLADSLDTGSRSSFISYESDRLTPVVRYSRAWSPTGTIDRG